LLPVAFTPKGGCPLKPLESVDRVRNTIPLVAFTPKGGCPLKLVYDGCAYRFDIE